jgi:hypothetical protein
LPACTPPSHPGCTLKNTCNIALKNHDGPLVKCRQRFIMMIPTYTGGQPGSAADKKTIRASQSLPFYPISIKVEVRLLIVLREVSMLPILSEFRESNPWVLSWRRSFNEVVVTPSAGFNVHHDLPRLWSVQSGRLMVVTDLHGDWEAYTRTREVFLQQMDEGEVDGPVFTGDLIHSESEEKEDSSLEIVLDIIRLREQYGDRVIVLLGNHEMPHIYSTTLSRGNTDYTPGFEAALSEKNVRQQVRSFFSSLPFYLRSASGVCITHAGASSALAQAHTATALFQWNHDQLLQQAEMLLVEQDRKKLRESFAHTNGSRDYSKLVSELFGLHSPSDPAYDDPLRGFMVTLTPAFRILWTALFTRCEKEYGRRYSEILDASMIQLSHNFTPQRVLVTGHMAVSGGVEILSGGSGGCYQIRIASAAHAHPRISGRSLIFNAGTPFKNIKDLVTGVKNIF